MIGAIGRAGDIFDARPRTRAERRERAQLTARRERQQRRQFARDTRSLNSQSRKASE